MIWPALKKRGEARVPFVQIDDATIHYELQGPEGAPVLMLLHALGTATPIFDPLCAALGSSFRFLRCDLRGHGLSRGGIDPANPATTIARMADDVLGVIAHLGIGSVAVCGVSIGGMVAQRVAARAPDLVRHAILCATGYRIGSAESWGERAALVGGQGLDAVLEASIGRWVTPDFAARHPAETEGLRAILLRTPVAGYVAGCAALGGADLEQDARSIRCPTLVIVGDQDVATPPDTARALAAAIPGARLEILEQAAHIPTVEQPERIAALIRGFVGAAKAPSSFFDDGMAVRRAVLGAEHVERSARNATPFDRDFQSHITEHVWGAVWTRGVLDRRTRSLLTIGLMAAMGHHDEFKLHIRATERTGVTPEEVKEALIHASAYAGVPNINTAFKLARETYDEMRSRETKR